MKKPFALYLDARKVGYLSSDIRIAQGKFFKDYKIELNAYCVGAVILVNSPFVSMMLNSISVIENLPKDMYTTFNEAEALNKIEEFLSKIKVASSS
ncbi:hypothetical protein QWY31_00380 [Cytophagales bacterium LB-30]|uniref:Uncharacterized protein n=2 Tax=Shiella aurantiaca TaxID=3058365 RepID=A0ABT8F126_9BACT|nr:hypothetical protein [Shiella aurantiaca]